MRAEHESTRGGGAEDESGRLAGFLSTVLKGLVDAEDKDKVRDAWVIRWVTTGWVQREITLCSAECIPQVFSSQNLTRTVLAAEF